MYVSIPDCFMISLFVGLVFGLVYEALRIIRLLLPFRIAIFICDILFFALASIVVMGLSEAMGNYVRIYTVLGFAGGVFAYISTIGRLLNIAESAASNAWRKAIRNIFHNLSSALKKLFGHIAHAIKIVFVKNAEYCQNASQKLHHRLKSNSKLMYNNKRLDKIGGSGNVIKASVRKRS